MGYRQKPIKAKSKFNRIKNSVLDHTGSSGLHRAWWLAPSLGPAIRAHTACHLGSGQLRSRATAVSVAIPWVLASPSAGISCYIWATLSLTASPRGLLRDSDLATVPSLNFSSQPFNPGPSTATMAAPSPVASPGLSSGTLALPHRAKPLPLSPIPYTFKSVPITKFGGQHRLQPPASLDRSLPSQLTLPQFTSIGRLKKAKVPL